MSREIKSRHIKKHLREIDLENKPATENDANNNKSTRVVIYTRVSTEEQANGYSIGEQMRVCKDFAHQKNWEIVETYSDEGYTGTNNRRPGFQQLQRDVKMKNIDVVLAHKIDRVFRDTVSMLTLTPEWQTYDTLFASVREQVDFSTSWGRLLLTIFSAISEWFVNNLREETKKGLFGRFKNRLHNGPIPWGYCRGNCSTCTDPNGEGYCPRFKMDDMHHGKHAVPHPIDSIAFRAAHEAYRTGNYSDRDIADFLNNFTLTVDEHTVQVRSRGKPGKGPAPFTKDMVTDLLQSIFYTGWVPFYGSTFTGKQVIKHNKYREVEWGEHSPLITEAQYDHAMDIRQTRGTAPRGKGRTTNNKRGKDKPRRASRVYVLQGLLSCARCGAPIHAQAGSNNARRHICSTRLQQKDTCDQPSVKADILERELTEAMTSISLSESWQTSIVAFLVHENGLHAISAQRNELREHFTHVKFLAETEEISRKKFNREKQLFERQMALLSLEKHNKFNLNRARALLADFPALWQQMTPLEQKSIVQSLLKVGIYDNQHVIEWRWYKVFHELFP